MPKITITIDTDTHKVVPLEPSKVMLNHTSSAWHYSGVYRAMVKAAPDYQADTYEMPNDVQATVVWLRSLADKGGKGTVSNVDARALGRVADMLCDTWGSMQCLRDQADTHVCDASGYICKQNKETFTHSQNMQSKSDNLDTLPPINEATGHDTQ